MNVNNVTIDVQGKDAILTTRAAATLRRLSDAVVLYKTDVQYQDRDTLENWTENDNALWHDYVNFARHYLGREITAQLFDRVELEHELEPKKTDTVAPVKKDDWHGVSRSTTPTLAWDLTLLDSDRYGEWANGIDEPDIFYDVEIYDANSLVYAERRVPDPMHTLSFELEPCKTYRWSVRPSYHIGSDVRFGEWMRSEPETEDDAATGNTGQNASAAPAYIRDFASLKIECRRG